MMWSDGCGCAFDIDCAGVGVVNCVGCGGDQCICDCGGDRPCWGCDSCGGDHRDDEPEWRDLGGEG